MDTVRSMRKALPLLVLAALPALLLTGCSGARPDPAGYTDAVMAYTDLTRPALAASAQPHQRQAVLERGRRTCSLLARGATTAIAQTRLTLDTARRSGNASAARAALEWYELNTAGEYLCPEHAALAKRIAAGIPGFGTRSSDSPDRYALSLRSSGSAAGSPSQG
jgi:hypothetical protein